MGAEGDTIKEAQHGNVSDVSNLFRNVPFLASLEVSLFF